MGVRTGLVAMVLLLAACGGSSAGSTSSTTTSPSTTSIASTTTTTTTTTTTEPGPVDLALSGFFSNPTRLTPDRTYRHNHWLVPIEFQFKDPGWKLDYVGQRIIGLTSPEATMGGGLLLLPDGSGDVRTAVSDHPTVSESTDPVLTTFAGSSATTFDVLIVDPDFDEANNEQFACFGPTMTEERSIDDIQILGTLVGCAWNRIWLIEVDGGTVVVFFADVSLSSDPPDELPAEYEPIDTHAGLIEQLSSAITIGG